MVHAEIKNTLSIEKKIDVTARRGRPTLTNLTEISSKGSI